MHNMVSRCTCLALPKLHYMQLMNAVVQQQAALSMQARVLAAWLAWVSSRPKSSAACSSPCSTSVALPRPSCSYSAELVPTSRSLPGRQSNLLLAFYMPGRQGIALHAATLDICPPSQKPELWNDSRAI